MPYKISGRGDALGCSGYGVQDEKGKTVGCHPTRRAAEEHLRALYANVPDAEKSDVTGINPSFTVDPKYPGVGIKRPEQGRKGGTPGKSAIGSKPGKTPKKKTRGRHSDAQATAQGAVSSGGSGGSLG